MALDDTALRTLARERDGVISWGEAIQMGFTWRSIATRVDRGSWARVGRAIIIRDLHHPGDRATAWLIRMHCGPKSIVSGPLATRLQGWNIAGSDHLVVSPDPIRPPTGYDWHVLRRRVSEVNHIAGLPPVLPRLDALGDVLVHRPHQAARELLDMALQRRWIDTADLDHLLDARSGPGRRGQPRLRELRDRAVTGSRSEAEHRMGGLLARTGGNWVANYPVLGDDGRILAEIDFADPIMKIAIEVDGRAFHSDRQSFERDRERQNMLVIRGWVILRFTWERIVNDPEGVVAEIIAAIASAPHRLRAHSA